MKKFAIVAFSFMLGCVLLTGCRGTVTDMTTTPSDNSQNTTQSTTTNPSESGANSRFRGENSHNRIEPQSNF